METVLSAAEVRVLGALIEKQISTPEYYPLSLNALVSACNQKSNRDPVVSYDEDTVNATLDALREKQLVRMIIESSRVPKYAHVVNQAYKLGRPEVAALCVLMLRGPQTSGEIRGRTGRLHEFKDLEEVERTLEELLTREAGPLVVRLPRQAGLKEARYAHLLAGEPRIKETAYAAEPGPGASAHGEGGTRKEERIAQLEEAVHQLQRELAELKEQFTEFRKQFE